MSKTGRPTVLLVEDEYIIAMELKAILEAHGWRVLGPSARVAHALAVLETEHPTVALLDVDIAGELVTPVAEYLKAARVPFALASAYDRPEMHGGAILAGAPNAGEPATARRLIAALDGAMSVPK